MNTEKTHNQLKSLIEKIENLEEERIEVSRLIRDAFTESKLAGFDPKIMKRVLKYRKMNHDQYLEEEHVLNSYLNAVGMTHASNTKKPLPAYNDLNDTPAEEEPEITDAA